MEEKLYQRQLEAALEASKRDSLSEAVTEDSEDFSHDDFQDSKQALASKASLKPRNLQSKSCSSSDDNKENRSSSEPEEKFVNEDSPLEERLCVGELTGKDHSLVVASKKSSSEAQDRGLDSEDVDDESKSNGIKNTINMYKIDFCY